MNRGAMKQQLSQVLAEQETDGAVDAVVRAFWSRAKPLAPAAPPVARAARVIDLRAWRARPPATAR
jgi:hypothetical protein